MTIVEYVQTGYITTLDTLIEETHTTFRDVIGGYIIKAATENVLRIVTGTVENYLTLKYHKPMDIDQDGMVGNTPAEELVLEDADSDNLPLED